MNIWHSQLPQNSSLDIARGKVPGQTHINKFGLARDGLQLTATDIWDRADSIPTQSIWLAPTAARIHQITSTNVADDGTPEGAGAGAQAVRIWGLLDWDTKEVSEDIILNGTANVPTTKSYVIIHRMKVIPLGTTYATNVGNITATADTDATVTAQITAGQGQSNMAILGVPSVQIGYLTNFTVNAHNTGNPSTVMEADFELLINEHPNIDTTVFINKSNTGIIITGNNATTRKYEPYKIIETPAIIKIQGASTLVDSEASAEFDIILVDKET